jgi:uncharacterized protein YcaQ
MTKSNSPIIISCQQARRFLLLHQQLLPPRSLMGKAGIQRFIRKVACIQFDPVNVVGRNPDLVLHARVKNYSPRLLDELLYKDRTLIDGWDKVSCIHLPADWPYFSRFRQRMLEKWWHDGNNESRLAKELLETIRDQGPYDSSRSLNKETVIWNWGRPARRERAALEILLAINVVGIASRNGNRRSFDLIERLLPEAIRTSPDPNRTLEEYHDWHVLRRIGSLGLAQIGATEFWLGIQYMKSPERKSAIERLLKAGSVKEVEIKELPGKPFFIRSSDLPTLHKAAVKAEETPQASFLPPLDNLLWDRKLLYWIFGFDYKWEQYTPAEKRNYSHYALPVLYGERFIARADLQLDRRSRTLTINHWWWEEEVKPGSAMRRSLKKALGQFCSYLDADPEVSLEILTT